MGVTRIEWTATYHPDGSVTPGYTFNPWIGCQKVSAGCQFCYAERDFTRKPRWANTWGPPATSERIRTSAANWHQPIVWNEQAERGDWRTKVFCASLGDVFEDHPHLQAWRDDLWALIDQTPRLDWLLLTKRVEHVLAMVPGRWFPDFPSNVWIGTSVENQAAADERIPALLSIPAPVRFVSAEPLLGAVDLTDMSAGGYHFNALRVDSEIVGIRRRHLDWVIIGCESGPQRRPMQLDWARDLVHRCQAAGVAAFVKQLDIDGRVSKDPAEWPAELRVREFPA
jgi:protein gp37